MEAREGPAGHVYLIVCFIYIYYFVPFVWHLTVKMRFSGSSDKKENVCKDSPGES